MHISVFQLLFFNKKKWSYLLRFSGGKFGFGHLVYVEFEAKIWIQSNTKICYLRFNPGI